MSSFLPLTTLCRAHVVIAVAVIFAVIAVLPVFKLIPSASADTSPAASISALGVPVTENFNTLASGGTSSVTPTGWGFSESGLNANGIYTTGNGSSNGGDTYSFGTTASDRALGGLRSGNLVPTLGAAFTNNTGNTITSLAIMYTGEQWRAGVSNRNAADRLDFQYSTDATSLTTGTWTDFNSLDFSSPNILATAGPLNGNDPGNRANISATITGLSLAAGATVFIRWTDFDILNADDGLAIDDFSLTGNGTGDPAPSVSSTSPTNGDNNVAVNSNITINFSESVTATASAFSIDCGGLQAFLQSASPSTSFTLDPTSDLPTNTVCTVTVEATGITDEDVNDPPDQMAANFSFSFTTVAPTPTPTPTPT